MVRKVINWNENEFLFFFIALFFENMVFSPKRFGYFGFDKNVLTHKSSRKNEN
jgi:hypothetical protein